MKNFRYLALTATAASAALLSASPAAAQVNFNGSITGITVRDLDPGLVIAASPIAFGPFSLNGIGDFQDAAVMTIGTGEGSIELDDWVQYDISAAFSFVDPTGAFGSPVTGETGGFIHLNPFNSCGIFTGGCGYVDWGSPQLFSFGDGGQFSVELFDTTFRTPGTATVTGRFTLLANSVPEPATWAMLLLGFGAIGATLRSKKSLDGRRLRIA